MNLIYGTLSLNNSSIESYTKKFDSNPTFSINNFFFVTQRIQSSGLNRKNYIYDKKKGVVITFVGVIKNFYELREKYNLDSESDLDLLIGLYSIIGKNLVIELNGLFTLIIFRIKERQLVIFQDIHSSPINLYYCVHSENFFFSTSLKMLLLLSGIKREINGDGVVHFFRKSCIPGEHTLLKNVSKLVPGQYLRISKKKDFPELLNFTKHSSEIYSEDFCRKNYYGIFRDCVRRSIDSLEELNIALSSGYDSNFLLYTLRDISDKKIRLYTVGGREGRDERGNASLVAKNYKNVEYFGYLLDKDSFKDLPEIIWRQEDLIHLPSNFVKLSLGKLIRSKGNKIVISGDCCDEVLQIKKRIPIGIKIVEFLRSLSFIRNVYCFIKREEVHFSCFKLGLSDTVKRKVYEYGPYRILKHAGIILNSFSIELRLPYLDDEFIKCAFSLQRLNRNKKLFHNKIVVEHLPDSVVEWIQHLGGCIDENFMFDSYKDVLTDRFANSEIARNFIGSDLIDVIAKDRNQYMALILKTLYLDLFTSIFISGRYDSTFLDKDFSIELDEFLND